MAILEHASNHIPVWSTTSQHAFGQAAPREPLVVVVFQSGCVGYAQRGNDAIRVSRQAQRRATFENLAGCRNIAAHFAH